MFRKTICGGVSEYSVSGGAHGTHKADGAGVLLWAEVPVLTLKRNGGALAAFFNVYPQLINEDRLHLHNDYGRDSISEIVKTAVSKLVAMMSAREITADDGKLIAFESQNNETVVLIYNPSVETEISPVITVKKSAKIQKLKKANKKVAVLEDTPGEMKIRVRLSKRDSALLVF